jgi:glycosyltransferase involved in cell wall biosynthesis
MRSAMPTAATGRFTSLTRALKFRALCRASDLVTAGNAYLADLSRAAGARRVEIFPTLVLERELSGASKPRGPGERLRLVWLGSASTKRYLLGVLPALVPVLESGVCELMVIADSDQGPALANTRYRRWNVELVTRWLSECHVGLAPLPDDPWTRGKCALKVLQYGAAALPTIAAPVGVQRDVIHPGHNGLHASTPDEWQRAVRTLAGDEAARRAMGRKPTPGCAMAIPGGRGRPAGPRCSRAAEAGPARERRLPSARRLATVPRPLSQGSS